MTESVKSQQDIFVMTIRPEPTKPGQPDPMYRLKGVLKVMLRRFGWRCLSVRPKSLDERQGEPNAGRAGTPEREGAKRA